MDRIYPPAAGNPYERSRKLLSDTKRPIAEISEQGWLLESREIAAVFKKQFGLLPLEYRRSKNLENG